MAKNNDNTLIWIAGCIGAFLLWQKLSKPATTTTPPAAVQNYLPVTTSTVTPNNSLSTAITNAGNLITNLFKPGHGDTQLAADNTGVNTIDESIDYAGVVLPTIDFSNISGIKKRIIDEND